MASASTKWQPYIPPTPKLSTILVTDVCQHKTVGQCANEECKAQHGIHLVGDESSIKLLACNILELKPRLPLLHGASFDKSTSLDVNDHQHRHDNDHQSITDVQILPTIDEILCLKASYMPEKKANMSAAEHLDLYFRHLRFDVTEHIVDACYDAFQRAIWSPKSSQFRFETPRGVPYSLLSDVKFENCQFHRHDGATFKLSFDCPRALRRFDLLDSNVFESGKLCSLIAIHAETSEVNVIHFQVRERQPSDPSVKSGGNRAAIQVSFADKNDASKVRQAAYYSKGLVKAKFFLVSLPGVLPASFMPALQKLQAFHQTGTFPFAEIIASEADKAERSLSPPAYALQPGFKYDISSLKAADSGARSEDMVFEPMKDGVADQATISYLQQQTTLDNGQAEALYENLSRQLAFTQGPPGTGKTFLGVAEAEVILKSQFHKIPGQNGKPLVVICMTNHALDDFVESLIDRGIDKVVRLGNRSTNELMAKYQLQKIKEGKKLPSQDWYNIKRLTKENDEVSNFGTEWADELSGGPSFRLLHDYLAIHEPDTLAEFERLDASGDIGTDLRFLRMSSAGFTFKHWLRGGDLQDLAYLLNMGLVNDLSAISLASYSIQMRTSEDLHLHQQTEEEIIINSFRKARLHTSDMLDFTDLTRALEKFSRRCRDNPNIHKLWLLNLAERQSLLASWLQNVDEFALCEAFAEIHRRYQVKQHARWDYVHESDARLIQQIGTQIVALTASGAARNWHFLEALEPEVYIIEEASELTEPTTIAGLVPSIQHLIKIGDPLQLRPHLNIQALSTEYDTRYRLDESLFERMMNKIPYSKLNMQRRAHPELADFLRAGCYPFLIDHPKTITYPKIPGIQQRMYWIDHNLIEDIPEPGSPLAKSCSNKYEARFICEAVKYLVQHQGFSMKRITILTPYNGQVAQILTHLKGFCNVLLNDADRDSLIAMGLLPENDSTSETASAKDVSLDSLIRLTTIDNYQGEENDIIFLSTVRSNNKNKLGFLANQNRINVAVSRARHAFYVVGNSSLLSQNQGWSQVIDVFKRYRRIGFQLPMLPCEKHNLITDHIVNVANPSNFGSLPVCQAPCNMALPCGHQCAEPCHAEEMHTDGRLKCSQPCKKMLECGHLCSNLCYQDCGPCTSPVLPVTLSCGHKMKIQCSTNLANLKCDALLVAFKGLCGHLRFKRCSTELEPCKEKCEKPYPCGHPCPNTCSDCEHTGCNQKCGKITDCGHVCQAPCHHTSGKSCPPCKQPCSKRCSHGSCKLTCSEVCKPCTKRLPAGHCSHQEQALLCSLPGSRIPCSKPCNLPAPCGVHQCQGLCGEDCPEICDICLGNPKGDDLIALPCKCVIEVTELDAKFQINKIYKMSGTTVLGIDITSLPDKDCLRCPTCGSSIQGSRRYALCQQLHEHNNLIGSLLSSLGRQLSWLMKSLNIAEVDLWKNLPKICRDIQPGPLAIKSNQETISQSLAGIQSIQREVERVQPEFEAVQNAILSYTASLVSSDPDNVGGGLLLGIPSLPYLLRSERVAIRCNIIMAAYLRDIWRALRPRGQVDEHLGLLLEVVKANIIANVGGRTVRLNQLVGQCQGMNLKRLEVEFFLQKICMVVLERFLGKETEGTSAQFTQIFQMCETYRSAKVLHRLVSDADGFIKSNIVSTSLDDALIAPKATPQVTAQTFWRRFANFEAGRLTKCASGHYYCSSNFDYCPECE